MAYKWLQKAVNYSQNSTEHEKLLILSYSAFLLDEPEKYVEYISQFVQKYPSDKVSVQQMGGYLFSRGDWEKSVKFHKRSAKLTNSPRPYDFIIDAFRKLGELDSARYYVNKQIQNYPNNRTQVIIQHFVEEKFDQAIHESKNQPMFRGIGHFFKNNMDSTEILYADYQKNTSIPLLSIIYAYQGKYNRTFKFLDGQTNPKEPLVKIFADYYKLIFCDLLNQHELTRKIWLDLSETDHYKRAFLYPFKKSHSFYLVDSLLALAIPNSYYKKNYSDVLDNCKKAELANLKYMHLERYLNISFWRAQTLFLLNQFEDALKEYQLLATKHKNKSFFQYRVAECLFKLGVNVRAKKVLNQISVFDNSVLLESIVKPYKHINIIAFAYTYPRQFYLRGKVNEKLGEKQEAIDSYQKFLTIWKNADDDLPEKIDAEKRLENLLN